MMSEERRNLQMCLLRICEDQPGAESRFHGFFAVKAFGYRDMTRFI